MFLFAYAQHKLRKHLKQSFRVLSSWASQEIESSLKLVVSYSPNASLSRCLANPPSSRGVRPRAARHT